MKSFDKARELLRVFKGDAYLFGNGVLQNVGQVAAKAGQKPVLIFTKFPGIDPYLEPVRWGITFQLIMT